MIAPIHKTLDVAGWSMGVRVCTIAVIGDDLRVRESLANLLVLFGYLADSYESAEQSIEASTMPSVPLGTA